MAKTELKIERTGPANDADVRLCITVPWDDMAHKIMKEISAFVPDGDQVLLGGAIPALAELVGRVACRASPTPSASQARGPRS